jgi:two-component system, LuxR family, response regulator FixJ
MSEHILVCIIDGDTAFRRSLKGLLQSVDINFVEYDSATAYLHDTRRLSLACAVLDIPGVDESVLGLLSHFRELKVPVIVTTQQANVRSAVQALKAGASNFLETPVNDQTVLAAINSALSKRGRIEHDRNTAIAREKMARLSRRERAVLEGLLAGRMNKQIAVDLGIALRTVEVYRARMLERLGVRSFAEAVVLAVTAQFTSGRDVGRR